LTVFRRRGTADDEPDDAVLDEEAGDPTSDAVAEAELPAPAAGPLAGPWDSTEPPADDVPRIDLGALLVPVSDDIELRVDVQEHTVVAATLVDGNSAMQVHAFAAPRSRGIWAEVRDEIADSLRQTGGTAEPADGPFGAELRARVPATGPDGQPLAGQMAQLQPMRFVGVDGPRWFLRGLLTGPAATDPMQARRLLDAFRGTVVVRGAEAMAPRDMLPLRLPKEALAAHEAAEPTEPARPTLEMLERGPEITETS
jgi:hypothetical protein